MKLILHNNLINLLDVHTHKLALILLGANKVGIAHGLILSRINHFHNNSSTYSCKIAYLYDNEADW